MNRPFASLSISTGIMDSACIIRGYNREGGRKWLRNLFNW